MIGRDCSTQSLGVAPTAISWLFKVIEERREKSGARFSVRVSAVEISGREETLTDLLAELSSASAGGHQEAPGPAVSLREDPLCGSQVEKKLPLHPLPLNTSLPVASSLYFFNSREGSTQGLDFQNKSQDKGCHTLRMVSVKQARFMTQFDKTLLDGGRCDVRWAVRRQNKT